MPTVNRKAPAGKNHTQSVLFKKSEYTEAQAKAWLKSHSMYSDGLDETSNTYRFRQYDPQPSKFDYRTKVISKGLSFILGFPK